MKVVFEAQWDEIEMKGKKLMIITAIMITAILVWGGVLAVTIIVTHERWQSSVIHERKSEELEKQISDAS